MSSAILLSIMLSMSAGNLPADVRQDRLGSSKSPDIVVLMLDDFPGDVDVRLLERMTFLDKFFVERGIRFTNVYGNNPLCCPGRVNFLTGLYSHNHGVTRNRASMFDPRMSIATQLQAAGYHTIHAGKYLNEYSQLEEKFPPGWDRFAATENGFYTDWWSEGTFVDRRSEYHTDVLKEYALQHVGSAPADAPLFLSLNPYAVHAALHKFPKPAPRHLGTSRCDGAGVRVTPAYNEADVSDKPSWVQSRPFLSPAKGWPLRKACESLLSVDEMFKAVTNELKAQGRMRDTIFLLTADNGMDWGDHRWFGKSTPSSTHIPLYVRWPAALRNTPGEVDAHISMVDLAPTLLEAAGAPPLGPFPNGISGPDGLSVLPTILSRGEIVPQRGALLEESPKEGGNIPSWYAIRTTDGAWHYVEYQVGEKELYDLVQDPYELENLAEDPEHADTVLALSRELARTK